MVYTFQVFICYLNSKIENWLPWTGQSETNVLGCKKDDKPIN